MTEFFRETLYPDIEAGYRVDEPIFEGRTAFQAVRVFRNDRLGRMLVLDGCVQTTERDEFVYHEMFAHVPILGHGAAKRVLIIGGGDGGLLEEVLKHPVEHVTMVEIDGEVVELCRQHLPSICGAAFEDPRTELVIGDGARFVAETAQRYDVILVDSTDPHGPGAILFQPPFYTDCRRCLNEGGVIATQNGVPMFQIDEFWSTSGKLAKIFEHSGFYFIAVPTYFGGVMALAWAGKGRDLSAIDPAELEGRFAAVRLDPRYYNPDIHRAAFARPSYLLQPPA